jgi:hypothetical protein
LRRQIEKIDREGGLRRTIEKELSKRITGITKKYGHIAVGHQKLPWCKSKEVNKAIYLARRNCGLRDFCKLVGHNAM